MDQLVGFLNESGRRFCGYAGAMFVQTVVLVAVLLLVDLLIRKRVKAAFRYWMWMLVFVKLLLPPTLALPTGVGYWLSLEAPAIAPAVEGSSPVLTPSVPVPTSISLPPREPAEVVPALDVSPQTAAPIVATPEAGPALTWQAVALVVWLVGLLVFGLLLVQRAFFVIGLIAQSVPAEGDLLDVLDRCARQVGVGRKIELRVSPNTFSPAVCRLFRPVILLPASLLEKLSGENLRAVLMHELAHIKRGDLWVNFAQTILQVVYFYNPLVWLAHAIVRRVREQAVDEMVLVALGAEARSYSRTLIDIAEMAFFRANLALRLIGVAESKKSLEGRIKHMLARPIPKSARIGFWGFIAIVMAAAVLLPMAQAQDRSMRDARPAATDGEYKILLLDDSDDQYSGKDNCDDRLYLMDRKGDIEGVVTGLNVCQSMGGSHVLGVDEMRKTLWVTENVGGRLWQIDLVTGQVKRKTPGLKASAVAVDPDTGNAWIVIQEVPVEKSRIVVVSPSGEAVEEYPIPGFDIAYSRDDDSFWVVGKDVIKVDKGGNVIGRISDPIPFSACSVSVDQKTGNAWLIIRAHPEIADSKPEVWIVDKDVRIQKRIDLGELIPFCVAVDSDNGVAWVGCLGATLRFTTSGEKLRSARFVSGFSVAPGGSRDRVIAASQEELMMATVLETGREELAGPPQDVRDSLSRSQKWVATVSFAGAKLQSSPELALLGEYKSRDQKMAEHPESGQRLKLLGKAALMYANDYDDKLPDSLDSVKAHVSEADLRWLKDNVQYAGKGMTTNDDPARMLAYDKTILREGEGTLVLYLDTHVAFETPERLAELGITQGTARLESAKRLSDMGTALLIYANEHGDKLPDDLSDIREDNRLGYAWLSNNVAYLGKGTTTADRPDRPVAYDKTLIEGGSGTNVLYLDSHVAFENPERLEEIDMAASSEPSLEDRIESRTRLSNLGRALLIYAIDHGAKLPDELMGVQEYDRVGFSWLYSNVAYLGKGMTTADRPDRPVAYDKTLIESGYGTNVLYLDSHVAFEHVGRLAQLGIRRDPQSSLAAPPISARKLARLGTALLVYAVDHGDTYPGTLDQIGSYVSGDELEWLKNNAEYLGKGKTKAMPPDTVMAYDKTLLQRDHGTIVLYLDCHIAFETPERLGKLGIRSKAAERVVIMERMRHLALVALLYAHEHEGRFADDLEALRPYVGDDTTFAWMQANAKYLGRGETVHVHDPARRPLAYWLASDSAVIAFFDGHVETGSRDTFQELGIEIEP